MQLDAVIFGGGVAGMWLLDELVREGRRVVLLESGDLGRGQTVAAQGILHGGLKYTLQGLLTRSAANIREMPLVWRECLAGTRQPNLAGTRIRSEHCYLWRTDSVASRVGMIGARFGLQVAPESLSTDERPAVLRNCPGTVAKLAEQVICPRSLLQLLAKRHCERIIQIDGRQGLEFDVASPGNIRAITLNSAATRESLRLEPRTAVFTAGAGNAELRSRAGLPNDGVMQRRPLHMVLVQGDLPILNGHCVDGAKTRVTITADRACGGVVWQLGGQIAEDGVNMDEQTLIAAAHAELTAVLPGVDLSRTQWTTYRVDRAEGLTSTGKRPDDSRIMCDGNTITAWPTKLVLAPQLAERIVAEVRRRPAVGDAKESLPTQWPRPQVAPLPWESARNWMRLSSEEGARRAA